MCRAGQVHQCNAGASRASLDRCSDGVSQIGSSNVFGAVGETAHPGISPEDRFQAPQRPSDSGYPSPWRRHSLHKRAPNETAGARDQQVTVAARHNF
jgi:hypothetical protein